MIEKPRKLHFIGIAGHTMSGIAYAASRLGYKVTGTDEGAVPPGSSWLDERQITWFKEPSPEHILEADYVIISGGVESSHSEVRAALAKQIPVISFSQFIDMLLGSSKRAVVSGTHGKTTTTALLAWTLEKAGLKPSFMVGAKPNNFPSSVRINSGGWAVIEGDEYRASNLDPRPKFEYYRPNILVITSIEMDHPDYFSDLGAVVASFNKLVNALPKEATVVYHQPNKVISGLMKDRELKQLTYGQAGNWRASNIRYLASGLTFTARNSTQTIVELKLPLFGSHNIDNALAVVAVAAEIGIDATVIRKAFATFQSTYRRFVVNRLRDQQINVIDDYAHHPTAVKTTIEAARLHFGGRCLAIFQPHTFSRTKELLSEFRKALAGADLAYVLDIEGAREKTNNFGVTSQDLSNPSQNVFYQPNRQELITALKHEARAGDSILFMSVSGFNDFARELADQLAGNSQTDK